jgi:hypothetical protein
MQTDKRKPPLRPLDGWPVSRIYNGGWKSAREKRGDFGFAGYLLIG